MVEALKGLLLWKMGSYSGTHSSTEYTQRSSNEALRDRLDRSQYESQHGKKHFQGLEPLVASSLVDSGHVLSLRHATCMLFAKEAATGPVQVGRTALLARRGLTGRCPERKPGK